MHDHATDGGRRAFENNANAWELRLHLDNAHDERTSAVDFMVLVERHIRLHAAEDARLAEIEAAANLIGDRLAEAPPAVVERVIDDRSMYLEDANGTVYLAEVSVWVGGPLYRLTVQEPEPEPVVDLMAALEESLAKTKQYLAKTSETIPSDAPGEESGPAGRRPSPGAPSSTAASNLLGTGSAVAAVGPSSEGARAQLPCRPAPSGSTGGAS